MIGIIAGAFDIIHPGYILAFLEAKQYCDQLVVCVHDDPSVERAEKMKPILTLGERTMILDSIKYVDEVIPYQTEDDFLKILKRVDPHIRFLGQDYQIGIDKITGAELNIPMHILDRSHGWSSTKLKSLIHEQMNRQEYKTKISKAKELGI
jgi:glycerol-3-phosphate cytidylyltransferase